MGNLPLHPTKGVNPHLTFCPRCGGDANELILVGKLDFVTTCSSCGKHGIGIMVGAVCPCGGRYGNKRTMEEHEKLPASKPCAKCAREIEEHRQLVEAGGVYWRCLECKRAGVIKASLFADAVRKAAQIDPPKPCGVEFVKCSEHGTKPEGQTDA